MKIDVAVKNNFGFGRHPTDTAGFPANLVRAAPASQPALAAAAWLGARCAPAWWRWRRVAGRLWAWGMRTCLQAWALARAHRPPALGAVGALARWRARSS